MPVPVSVHRALPVESLRRAVCLAGRVTVVSSSAVDKAQCCSSALFDSKSGRNSDAEVTLFMFSSEDVKCA